MQLLDRPAWPIDTTYYSGIPPSVDPRFLFHQLSSMNIARLDSSTTTPSLRREDLEALGIVLPPYEEQRRIAEILENHLSRLDAAQSLVSRGDKRLSNLRALMLEDAISGDWPQKNIGSIATIGSGATPLKSRRDYYEGGTIPWVTSGALNDSVVTAPTAYISKLAMRETAVKLWPPGALLVAMYGEGKTRGRCGELAIPSTTNQACAAIVMQPERSYSAGSAAGPPLRAVPASRADLVRLS